MMIGVLSDFFRPTREHKCLDPAVEIYDFAAGGTPKICESTASHKFAWGCAWLCPETGKWEHLESACRLCDYLAGIQEADGSFVHWAFVKSAEEWLSQVLDGEEFRRPALGDIRCHALPIRIQEA
jgi:hypothetical protein